MPSVVWCHWWERGSGSTGSTEAKHARARAANKLSAGEIFRKEKRTGGKKCASLAPRFTTSLSEEAVSVAGIERETEDLDYRLPVLSDIHQSWVFCITLV